MNGFLLAMLLAGSAAAEGRKAAEPLPAKPPPDEYRVVVDDSAEPKDEVDAPAPHGKPGVKRHGMGRLVSVDAKDRRIVLEHEDGVEETFTVPDTARLSFASDERPLKLDQLRRGDAVAYAVDGGKAARLHLDLCSEGAGGEEENIFAPPQRNRGRARDRRPPPPPPEDDEPDYRSVDEPDVPMYQSEPPEPPPSPKKAAVKQKN